MAESSPTAAFVLSLIGGFFVILGGILLAILGAIVSFFIGGIGAVFGIAGVFFGVLIIVFAALLHARPAQHVIWGALLVLFALVSFPVSFFGGFIIGFLLTLIGGILAIVWHPPAAAPAQYAGPMQVCLKCGTQRTNPAPFCAHCGAPFPAAMPPMPPPPPTSQ
jgi:hypothetical protein